jgi:hypothetical protein
MFIKQGRGFPPPLLFSDLSFLRMQESAFCDLIDDWDNLSADWLLCHFEGSEESGGHPFSFSGANPEGSI